MKLLVCLLCFAAAGCNVRVVGPGKPPVVDQNENLVIVDNGTQSGSSVDNTVELVQAMERPSGLLVFVCLCVVLLLIVMITMGYSKLITPKIRESVSETKARTKQVIQEQQQDK
jgi:hypothetical protein